MKLIDKEARIIRTESLRKSFHQLNDEKFPHEDAEGYVYMEHGDTYGIWLRNHTHERNDVIIEIDGKEVGGWRLASYQTATIEHSADDSGRFTFYEIGSTEAQKVGLSLIARSELGLVKITFIPEKPRHHGIPAVDIVRQSYSGAKGGGAMKGGDWQQASFSSGSRGGAGGQSVNLNTRSAGGTGLSDQ